MRTPLLVVSLAAAALGCASTNVTSQSVTLGQAPKPELVVVRSFATSPEDVSLDHSPTAVAAWKLQGVTASSERRQVGQQVADALADNLVKDIQKLGLPAERARGPLPDDGVKRVVIEGQFLSINEGSRLERVSIGLGAGKSEVRTAVQTIEILPYGSRLLDTFEITAKSGDKPGMAETMGVGAAAGDLAVSAAVSAAGAVASEEFGTDVDADARRTADKISKVLASYFQSQGWIAPGN
jgi:hypothetical protein